ncbi:MAG: uridine kinase [Bacteroidota bacterium]|nr:uridine kinase [Bacteroidota bacterium]
MQLAKPFIVGITGASGSGKTSVINQLIEKFEPGKICLISQDHYYKKADLQPVDSNGYENYDVPESINIDDFVADVKAVASGNEIKKMEYNFNNPNLLTHEITFTPSPILILEGIFIFHFLEIREMIDLKVFIDTYEDIRTERRIKRDVSERGHPLEEIKYRILNHVEPSYKLFVEPHKDKSDIILKNNESYDVPLQLLYNYLIQRI